jgi:hypothetical protein
VAFGARSVEWVRADVPFGNALVDKVEQLYYTANAPKKGGPQLKSLPTVGLTQPATSRSPQKRRKASHESHRNRRFRRPASLHELLMPEPTGNEVLVRVRESSVNGFDLAVANGYL